MAACLKARIKLYLEQYQLLTKWIVSLSLLNGVLFCFIGLPYLNAILSYGTLYKNKIFDFSFPLGKAAIFLYAVLNYTSHFFILSLLVAGVLVVLATCFPFRRFIIISGTVLYCLCLNTLLIDIYLFNTYHFHLNQTLLGFILSRSVVSTLDMSMFEVLAVSCLLLVLLMLEGLLARYAWRYANTSRAKYKQYVLWAFSAWLLSLMILLFSMTQKVNILSQHVSNLPLQHQILLTLLPGKTARRHLYNFSENYYSEPNWDSRSKRFHYPVSPMQCRGAKQNIIMIMVDALRFDVLEKDLMPALSSYADKALVFDNHLSGGNATQSGLFSLFYSLPSNYWSAALREGTPPVLNSVLKDQGYDRKVIWSSEMTVPPFHKTIYKGIAIERLEHQKGAWPSDWDIATTKQATAYLDMQAKQQTPFYLNLFYSTTHAYCQNNPIPEAHKPVIRYCSRMLLTATTDPTSLYHRYQNAVEFIDKQIGQLLSRIEQLGLMSNSIVIITSDHGEEFNDTGEGYFGHAGNFSNYQLQVPMIVFWPNKKPRHIPYQTTHYDIVPTLMQSLFHCKTPIEDYSVGKNLFDKKTVKPLTLVGSYAFMGWVTPDHITVLRKSGEISLQDKNTRPIAGVSLDKNLLNKALNLMRRYVTDQKYKSNK